MKNRRDFLSSMAALTAGILIPTPHSQPSDRLGDLLPLRKFGSTGEEVTMLGVGGAHIGRSNERVAQEIIEAALENGIRFFDNAESYNSGRAERYYGQFLSPKYRDVAYIMTKTTARDGKTARRHLEQSLKNMKTDYIDLYQIHAITNPSDVDNRLDQGVLETILNAREEGLVRHIGFTGHSSFSAHQRMLEKTDVLQTCQMPMNMYDPNYKSFVTNVLPTLLARNFGVIAMKTLSNGGFFGGTSHFQHGSNPRIVPNIASIEKALHFVWSLPVSVIVTGAESIEMVEEKAALARSFSGMSAAEREGLIESVAHFDGGLVEFYKT
jgi:aryl-alcohol dehydrogenase-like predicted oxidoreductase